MRFRQIEDQQDNWPVRVMCDALSVSSSGYYAWRSRPESRRKSANRALLVDIQRVHARHRERYGAPRIHAALRAEGQTVGRKRIERMMRPGRTCRMLRCHLRSSTTPTQDAAVLAVSWLPDCAQRSIWLAS